MSNVATDWNNWELMGRDMLEGFLFEITRGSLAIYVRAKKTPPRNNSEWVRVLDTGVGKRVVKVEGPDETRKECIARLRESIRRVTDTIEVLECDL